MHHFEATFLHLVVILTPFISQKRAFLDSFGKIEVAGPKITPSLKSDIFLVLCMVLILLSREQRYLLEKREIVPTLLLGFTLHPHPDRDNPKLSNSIISTQISGHKT